MRRLRAPVRSQFGDRAGARGVAATAPSERAVAALALGGIGPPGPRRRTAHEVDRGHEDVEHAGVLPLPGRVAELAVQREGIARGEVARVGDAEPSQVGSVLRLKPAKPVS